MSLFFYLETSFRGGGCMSPTPKFKLRIAQEGKVYKIWDLVYKIVQNKYKIMIQFFILKLHLGGCMSPAPQIWIVHSARRKGVQNLGLGVQNLGLDVQNLGLDVQNCTK